MNQKPILFLDFDRTLFDTEQFSLWLGEDYKTRLAAISSGELAPPDFSTMLYAETIPFLTQMSASHKLVVLTLAASLKLQKRKLDDSGVMPYIDDAIITEGDKGVAAKAYLEAHHKSGSGCVFVDDKAEKLGEMLAINPEVRCFLICRNTPEITENKEGSIGGGKYTIVSSLFQLEQYLNEAEQLLSR